MCDGSLSSATGVLPLPLHMNAALFPGVLVTRNGRAIAVEKFGIPPSFGCK